MPGAIVVVKCTFPPGREHECADWYDNTHFPDMLTVPGVLSTKRYQLTSDGHKIMRGRRPPPGNSLLIYELDHADIDTFISDLNTAMAGFHPMFENIEFGEISMYSQVS